MRRRLPQRRAPLPSPDRDQPVVSNPQLRAALLEGVDAQLASGEPPEVRATLERLVARGYTRAGARELIGIALAAEVDAIMRSQRPFDHARYAAALAALPELPGE